MPPSVPGPSDELAQLTAKYEQLQRDHAQLILGLETIVCWSTAPVPMWRTPAALALHLKSGIRALLEKRALPNAPVMPSMPADQAWRSTATH